MNVIDPFSRTFIPQSAASPVTRYTAEEAGQLLQEGKITSPAKIPSERQSGRISLPDNWGRGNYGFGNGY